MKWCFEPPLVSCVVNTQQMDEVKVMDVILGSFKRILGKLLSEPPRLNWLCVHNDITHA
jgi:hypothetical protein